MDALIGENTINTLPLETIGAYRDHGHPEPRLEQDVEQAHWILKQLQKLGIDLDQLTQELEHEGVEKFNKAFDSLMDALAKKSARHRQPEHLGV